MTLKVSNLLKTFPQLTDGQAHDIACLSAGNFSGVADMPAATTQWATQCHNPPTGMNWQCMPSMNYWAATESSVWNRRLGRAIMASTFVPRT